MNTTSTKDKLQHIHPTEVIPDRRFVIKIPLQKYFLAVSVASACLTGQAQTVSSPTPTVYSERGQLIRAPRAVTTLGPDLFGDKVNLYNGSLEFVQTDVSLPGNNNLPVSVARKLSVGGPAKTFGHFKEWDLEIPRIQGRFSNRLGWQTEVQVGVKKTLSPLRCTNFGAPPEINNGVNAFYPIKFRPVEYWHGNYLYVPGVGSQEILRRNIPTNTNIPSDGQATPLVTTQLWSIRCLSTLASTTVSSPAKETGEGFLAIAPDGTQYRFDWLVSRSNSVISKPTYVAPPAPVGATAIPPISSTVPPASQPSPNPTPTGLGQGFYSEGIDEVWILPTVITDRFGNTVTYTYDTVEKWKLLRIQSSDGRTLTFSYGIPGTPQITAVTDGTRSWNYTYAVAPSGMTILTSVTLPDGTSWKFTGLDGPPNYQGVIGLNGLIDKRLTYYTDPSASTSGECDNPGSQLNSEDGIGTMVHPSGAIGTFTVRGTPQARNGVPKVCFNDTINTTPTAYYPRTSDVYAMIEKTITGPGLPTYKWTNNYDGTFNPGWDDCTTCKVPAVILSTDPDGVVTRYTYGSTFRIDEGQLQKTEIGWNGTSALKTITQHYYAAPAPAGFSDQDRGDSLINTYMMSPDQRVTNQDGVTFTWAASGFDSKARPAVITRSSTLGSSRTETTVYYDVLSKWILGQTDSVTESSTGAVMVKNTFDATNGNVLTTSKFGLLEQTLTYYTDGTLATRKDGNNKITTYSNYKRGLAQLISYPDATSESAVVNNIGLIDSTTNAATFTTNYGYDAMGRLNRVTYPTGDNVVWNDTTLLFEPVASAEYGLAAGHWRQTVSTGNARTITYYDGMWRPVLVRSFDNAAPSTTSQVVLNRYDYQGRTLYSSYPQRDIASVAASPSGVTTTYDTLGRVKTVTADSELGSSVTTTNYLNGFQKQVINPRGQATTTSYRVFDEPAEDAPIQILAPENLTVTINRDIFNKPTSIIRSGGTVNATRSYVYDINQRLCKTIEPEIGATLQDYDGANNVLWRAVSPTLTTATCDRASVPATSKISYAYDALNRLTNTTYADASPAITRTYTADGLEATVSIGGSNANTWTNSYNKRRLLTANKLTYNALDYVLQWDYNANGNPTQLTYPDGKAINMNPNALGQASQVENYATNITYHPNGAVAGFTYGNGIVHSLTQNVRGLPQIAKDNGILQDTYSYDANANVLSITDGTTNNTSRSMTYDNLDRLKTTDAPGMWGLASYNYDVLDNIVQSVIGSRTNIHNYDATKNRLQSITSNVPAFNLSYSAYDNQGNITQRGAQTFNFDLGNRLTSAVGKASYFYDGYGRRVKVNSADGTSLLQIYSPAGQLLYTKQSGGPNSAKETKYIYLNRHVIAEVAK